MQSHLTRSVFRAIVNNEPLFSRCRNRFVHTSIPAYRNRRLGVSGSRNIQRRGFFAFNVSQPSENAEVKSTTLQSEVGLRQMRSLSKSLKYKHKSPSNDVLAKAFQDFFVARAENPGVITGHVMSLLMVTWRHLKARQEELEIEDWAAVFSKENLENVLFVLSEATCLPESRNSVQKLARYAFSELVRGRGVASEAISRQALVAYVSIQSLNGNPEEAQHIVHKFWGRLQHVKPSPYLTVIKGFAMNDDKKQIKRISRDLDNRGSLFDCNSHEEMTKMLIDIDVLGAVKTIYECPISDSQGPSFATRRAVLRYAIKKSETAWAKPIFESFSQTPKSEVLDIILLWEAANGKRASEIAEKVKMLEAENPAIGESLNISVVNTLIEFANDIKAPGLAAEFEGLVPQWGLEPEVQTQVLLLEGRVQAGDVNGALMFLQSLPDVSAVAIDNIPLMNRLIRMLCTTEQNDDVFDQISLLLDPVFESNVRLEAETIAVLTRMLLYRLDLEAVSELLRPRLGSYDSGEKAKIRAALTEFILDPSQDTNLIWQVYNLLRLAFPDTPVSIRTEIMSAFFKREQSEFACQVFGHMRQAEDVSQRPKPITYAMCFQGLSQVGDTKNLELIHNMLKLDVEVNLNTRILNGLMLAYAACGMAEQSMEVFRDILQTEEGASHTTIGVFFKVCEKHHNGAQEAMKMMSKVKILEITVDRQLYMAYVEALAAQCEFDLTTEAIDKMESETGYAPTRNTIGLFYNSIPFQYWKDEVEKWARVKYPEQWAQLEAIERVDHEDGLKFEGISNEVFV